MHDTPSEYEQERRQKLQKLRDLGVDPFGGRVEGLLPLARIKSMYAPEMGHDAGPTVKAAGRVMLKRDMGKLSFLTLRDESGDLQVALDKKRLDEAAWQVNGLIDLGDQIVTEGPLGITKKGEVTVWATRVQMAAKALLPPPSKEFVSESSGQSLGGFSDVELRYRQRYVDLWANPDVMRLAKVRVRIVEEVRRYMRERGFVEVETPMMQPIAGGAAAKPFQTHHNALDMPLYLRIAPELYLKRLLVGGFAKVFEVNRNFRNEGISPRHNPEFTMLEAYEAYGSWETMADLVEGMICSIAQNVEGLPLANEAIDNTVSHEQIARRAHDLFRRGAPGSAEEHWARARRELSLKIEHRDDKGEVTKTINLARPWRRVRLVDLVEERTGWRFDKRPVQQAYPPLLAALQQKALGQEAVERFITHPRAENPAAASALVPEVRTKTQGLVNRVVEAKLAAMSPAEQLQEVYEKLVEPTLIDPTFVTHFPSVIIPLARENRDDPFFCDVYELAINGQEISPGYSELNDPDVQAKHFAHQVGDKEEQHKHDEDFLTALRYGMPPAGGMGLGVDRLVMMLTGAESIRDVILFPLMKPERAAAEGKVAGEGVEREATKEGKR